MGRRAFAVLIMLLALLPAALPVPVRAAAVGIHLSPAAIGRDDTTRVTGTGFTPGDLVAVFAVFDLFGGNTRRVAATATASSTGTVAAALSAPDQVVPGAYTVTARDEHARAATAVLTILPVLALAPTQAVPHATVAAGHRFLVRGGGLVPRAHLRITAAFSRYAGAVIIVSHDVVTSAHGTFADVTLTVPPGARPGTVTVTATDLSTHRRAVGTLTIVYRPFLGTLKASVQAGGQLLLTGRGWVPNSGVRLTVTIPANNVTEQLGAEAHADANGSFRAALPIPPGAHPGTYRLHARDTVGGYTASTLFHIALQVGISLAPTTAKPGSIVAIIGAGFPAGAIVTVSADVPLAGGGTTHLTTTPKAGAHGVISTSLQIPANAAAGTVTVVARAAGAEARATFRVVVLNAAITVSPPADLPGATVLVHGTNWAAKGTVTVSTAVTVTGGTARTVSATATANAKGSFTAYLHLPPDSSPGTYRVTATQGQHSVQATLAVASLAPSIVAQPTTAVPGTSVSVSGVGFPAGVSVALTFDSVAVGNAVTSDRGTFTVSVTVPAATPTGSATIVATSGTIHVSLPLQVNRQVSTYLYVPSLYTGTGYHEYLTLLNPTEIRAKVTVTYQGHAGTSTSHVLSVAPHTRFTEDVNIDLGPKVAAAAVLAADVPVAAERVVYHGKDGDVTPAVSAPKRTWYFADGNTAGGYRQYIALQNPNPGQAQVSLRFLTGKGKTITVARTLPPTSRLTVKVNKYVSRAANGVIIKANAPIIANQTVYIHQGMTSQNGVSAPAHTWYFAGSPLPAGAQHWIGLINPGTARSYVTVQAIGPFGGEVGRAQGWVAPGARVGYRIDKLAHGNDVAVVVTASQPVVAEATSYVGGSHRASTDTFGAAAPARSWTWSAVNTNTGQGEGDTLQLFNPGLVPVAIVVRFITTAGATASRTYVIGPQYHQSIDVASVEPGAQLGMVAASNAPFVALNRGSFAFGQGAFADSGLRGK